MKNSQLRVLFIFCLFFSLHTRAQAQQQGQTAQSNPNGYIDLAVKTGSLLPYDIEGVRELLPMWGLMLGHSLSRSLSVEYDLDFANAKGVKYYLFYVSLRHDFVIGDVLPLFFNLGFDAHHFKRRDSYGEITGNRTEYDFRTQTGWHLGFGTETQIYGDLQFRTNFRMGFGPGRQLIVNIAGVYRF